MAKNKSLLADYEKGTPLHDAVFKFLEDKRLHRAYCWAKKRQTAYGAVATLRAIQTMRSPTIPDSTKDVLAQGLGIDWRKPRTDKFCIRDPNRYQRAERPPKQYPEVHLKEIHAVLENDIRNNKYVLIGYSEPRDPDDDPKRVRADVISRGNIHFGSSSIVGNGLNYIAIRLVRTKKNRAIENAPRAKSTRSKKAEIEKVARPLIEAGKITPNTPDKKVGNLVRDAASVPEDEKGYSDDTIVRHIKRLLPLSKKVKSANP